MQSQRFRICSLLIGQSRLLARQPTTIPLCRWCSKGKTTPQRKHWLRWSVVPVGAGVLYLTYQYRRPSTSVDAENANGSQTLGVSIYRALPLNALSRMTGKALAVELPVWLRRPVYGAYVWATGCNMDEAAIKDLQFYKSLQELFRRQIKTSCRPIDQHSNMVSPSDGRVLHLGTAENGILEQVKGVTYSLQHFLGPDNWQRDIDHSFLNISQPESGDSNYQRDLGLKPGNKLYSCVIYLAPGDYHRYHAPADWTVHFRRHFPGDLLSVSPVVARWVRGLFCINERVVYVGEWRHGFLAMAPVGATNVGSIKVYHDQELRTNLPHEYPDRTHLDKYFNNGENNGISFKKGESFGEFNFGSTIVLLFEAPPDFQFKIAAGDTVHYGQAL